MADDPGNSAATPSSPTAAAVATNSDNNHCKGGKATASTASSASPGLNEVPVHLRIQVIYQDEDIIVVLKPCNLRSVPGNADNNNTNNSDSDSLPFTTAPGMKKRKHVDEDETATTSSTRTTRTPLKKTMTPQEAWVQALKSLSENQNETDDETEKQLQYFLKRLGGQESQRASIPRRFPAFVRYIKRSRNRVFGEKDVDSSSSPPSSAAVVVQDEDLPEITQQLFHRIETKQKEILQQYRPQPTTDKESVVGQCKLLGLAKHSDSRANQDLFVVHRLDCQTSGLLVLARTAAAASFLSKCWRTRDKVQKTYRALVECWPPLQAQPAEEYQEKEHEVLLEGEISLPMSPHPTERLKWIVNQESGKESLTKWKVLQIVNGNYKDVNGDGNSGGGVVLELKPITGRTHQLRVHCAAMGGVIRGDSLYGKVGDFLYLHAEKLAFPHPSTKDIVSFQVDPKW